MEYAAPIPGFEQYTVTPNGEVFNGNHLLKHWKVPGRAARVKVKDSKGKIIRVAVAKLIALTFIANPHNHSRIIFKDRDKNNCTVDNIQWVSASECTMFAQRTIESDELGRVPVSHSKESDHVQLKDYPGYSITAYGEVFNGAYLLKASKSPGRAARVKVRDKEGKAIRIAIAKLIALAFIPNPDNHSKIIFKDRDNNNCTVDNIQWVSTGEFTRFVNHHAERDNLLGPPRPKRKPDWIDPERVPLEGYPGYFLTPSGVLYKGDRICKPSVRKNKSTRVRIWQQGRYKFFGLAKLVAEHFIPNPKNHRYVIFKDRDNHNCHVSNIAWVDAETFTFYCGIHAGAKKRVLPREEAIRRCTNMYLRAYYETLDESWLHDCWAEVEERIKLPDWDACKSDCYLYFIDRARRFSLLKDPVGLMVVHMKGVRAKIRKEISPDMPVMAVVRTDESLRRLRRASEDVS
jgi:hypothetical protein